MGGVAAALSVVIIMGRRYDQAPMAFTITRLVETFIGISCGVLADLVFQPGARPSVQAGSSSPGASPRLLKRVQQELALLRKYAAEAGSEPTYLWLPPFQVACYDKIQGSLGRMVQLLQLYHQARRHQQVDVDDDTNTLPRPSSSSLASTCKEAKGQVVDLEAGTAAGGVGCSRCYKDDEVLGSFLAQARAAKLLLLTTTTTAFSNQRRDCC